MEKVKASEFAAIPLQAIADTRLSGLQLRVLAAVAYYDRLSMNSEHRQGCWAGNDTLAKLVGCHHTRLSTAINDLCRLGYLYKSAMEGNRRRRRLQVIYEPTIAPRNAKEPMEARRMETEPSGRATGAFREGYGRAPAESPRIPPNFPEPPRIPPNSAEHSSNDRRTTFESPAITADHLPDGKSYSQGGLPNGKSMLCPPNRQHIELVSELLGKRAEKKLRRNDQRYSAEAAPCPEAQGAYLRWVEGLTKADELRKIPKSHLLEMHSHLTDIADYEEHGSAIGGWAQRLAEDLTWELDMRGGA